MGLVMGFVGLCWGFTPTRKSNLMLTCGGASMLTPKDLYIKERGHCDISYCVECVET
jgi:hypothetical protein